MASGFLCNGVNYPLTITAGDVPLASPLNVTPRHVPGGNVNYVDIGGSGVPHLVIDVLFTNPSDEYNFSQTFGQVGVLTDFNDRVYEAVAQGEPRRTAHGVSANGESIVQVDFLLLRRLV